MTPNSFKYIFLLFAVLALMQTIWAQQGWVRQSPLPIMNVLNDVQFLDVNTGFTCGRWGMVFKTTDSGVNWTETNAVDTVDFKKLFFINSNTGYASGSVYNSGSYLYKTTNGGTSWLLNYIDPPGGYSGDVFFVDVNTGYFAEYNSLLKTTNGGIVWFQINSPISNNSKVLYFQNSLTGFIGSGNNTGALVFRTTDGGLNWIETDLNLSVAISSISFVDSLNGYLSGIGNSYNSYVFKTTDGGISWLAIQLPGLDAAPLSIAFSNVNTGYLIGIDPNIGTSETILRTTDAGQNWNPVLPTLPVGLRAICVVGTNCAFAVGFESRIVKSTNQGLDWNYLGSIGPISINALHFFNQFTGIVVGLGVARTVNGGVNWVPVPLPPDLQNITFNSVSFLNNTTGFAVGGYSTSVIMKTTDKGITWHSSLVTNDYSTFDFIYFVNEALGYLIGEPYQYSIPSLLSTTNGGDNWIPVQLFSDSGIAGTICFTSQNTGYIAGSYNDSSEIFKTTNGGNNWTRMHLNIGVNLSMNSISFPSSATGYIASDGNKILKTTNAGVNWTLNTLSNVSGLSKILFVNTLAGYGVGTYLNKVIKTTDGGNNWVDQDSARGVDLYFFNETTGWVGGLGCQIFKTTTGGNVIGVQPISENIPVGYKLFQNYPNPFNPTTKIKYGLPMTARVSIKVYDILGRLVTVLTNNETKEAGYYEVSFDATNLSSGVYFYTIEAGSFAQSKKMVVLK